MSETTSNILASGKGKSKSAPGISRLSNVYEEFESGEASDATELQLIQLSFIERAQGNTTKLMNEFGPQTSTLKL